MLRNLRVSPNPLIDTRYQVDVEGVSGADVVFLDISISVRVVV